MNMCPDCGAILAEGMTCRDLFYEVMGQEYMRMAYQRDYLAAHKLTGVSYILQHPHEHTPKEVSFASQMVEMVIRDGYFPLDAAEVLQRQFAYRAPDSDETLLRIIPQFGVLNVGNFRQNDEPYLESAYRWARSVYESLRYVERETTNS